MNTHANQPVTLNNEPATLRRRFGPFWQRRMIAAIVFVGCAGVLLVASQLSASSKGVGTHTQLGLPPCTLLTTTGIPCFTCGMTTAFTHAAHGEMISAFKVQPAGTVLAILTAMMALVSGYALVSGASIAPVLQAFTKVRVLAFLAGILLAGWIYKLLIAFGVI